MDICVLSEGNRESAATLNSKGDMTDRSVVQEWAGWEREAGLGDDSFTIVVFSEEMSC